MPLGAGRDVDDLPLFALPVAADRYGARRRLRVAQAESFITVERVAIRGRAGADRDAVPALGRRGGADCHRIVGSGACLCADRDGPPRIGGRSRADRDAVVRVRRRLRPAGNRALASRSSLAGAVDDLCVRAGSADRQRQDRGSAEREKPYR